MPEDDTLRLHRRRFLELAAGSLAGLRLSRAVAAEAPSLALEVHRATRAGRGRGLWVFWERPDQAKPYPGRPRAALPHGGGTGGPVLAHLVRGFRAARALAEAPLDVATLARLLHRGNGVTQQGPPMLRAAPSAGALYAGELYVVARRVRGLAAGVYSYHVPTHQLVRLAQGDAMPALAACVESPAALARAPAALLVTNVFRRYAHRYAHRGYRYALIDTGHIAENLRLAASAEGLAVGTWLRFEDDALHRLLDVDGREEAVCALLAVGRAAPDAVAAPRLVEAGLAAGGDPASPLDYHAATKLVRGEGAPVAAPEPRPVPSPGDRALPERTPSPASFAWSVGQRRSARRFLPAPLALEDLAYLLGLARDHPDAALAPGVELRIVAHWVEGLRPGVYRYAARQLVPVREGDAREALRRACGGQDKAATAAAGVAMLADLADVTAARGYRDLLIEAGAVAQRLYLGAESIGLAARNLSAFSDQRLDALLAADGVADGTSPAAVHLTMLGPGD